MTKFLQLHNFWDRSPILINIEAIQCVQPIEPNMGRGTLIRFTDGSCESFIEDYMQVMMWLTSK